MKKSLIRLQLFSLLWLVGACSTVYIKGQNFDDTQLDALVIGETDKARVLQQFGEPFRRGRVNHSTVFMYAYEETEFPPKSYVVNVDRRYKSLTILFDENDKVKYLAHNLPPETGTCEMMRIHQEKIRQQDDNDDTDSDGY